MFNNNKNDGRKSYVLNTCKAFDMWLAANKHQDMYQIVKKVMITGGSKAHKDKNSDKEYKAYGDVLEGFKKKKKTRFAYDLNFTEKDLGPKI
eukprot:5506366-Ditylum_brightwellii.AAC.1